MVSLALGSLSSVIRMPSTALVQESYLSHGRFIPGFLGVKGGSECYFCIGCLSSTLNNQYAKMSYFRMMYFEHLQTLHQKTQTSGLRNPHLTLSTNSKLLHHNPCPILIKALLRPTIPLPANISSVQFSRSVVSDSLRPHESQHARPPCPSTTPRIHSNSCPSSR